MEAGKYEKMDEDHNKIWKLQSGNLGEGKGIMSEAEQKELINQVFMQKGTYSGSKLIAGGDRLIDKITLEESKCLLGSYSFCVHLLVSF